MILLITATQRTYSVKPTDKEITFYSFDNKLQDDPNNPITALYSLPHWYREAERYLEGDVNKPTFKACMPFFDAMSLGYCFVTPTDILIEVDGDDIHVSIDEKYKTFIEVRPEMKGFSAPDDCYPHHIAVLPQWGVSLPEGYSALYVSPLNRFDLPWVVTNGIIENDKMDTPGNVPLFLKRSFKGVIPKGTPYVQIIPFKRELWKSNISMLTDQEAHAKQHVGDVFRTEPSGVYKKLYWERKVYK